MDEILHLKIPATAGLDEFLDESIQRQVKLLVKKNKENVAFINGNRKFPCDNNMCPLSNFSCSTIFLSCFVGHS